MELWGRTRARRVKNQKLATAAKPFGKSDGRASYPENAQPLAVGPAAQEVNFKGVVEDHDGVLLPIQRETLWVRVERAFCA